MIDAVCTCGRTVQVSDDDVGKRFKCSACGGSIVVLPPPIDPSVKLAKETLDVLRTLRVLLVFVLIGVGLLLLRSCLSFDVWVVRRG